MSLEERNLGFRIMGVVDTRAKHGIRICKLVQIAFLRDPCSVDAPWTPASEVTCRGPPINLNSPRCVCAFVRLRYSSVFAQTKRQNPKRRELLARPHSKEGTIA